MMLIKLACRERQVMRIANGQLRLAKNHEPLRAARQNERRLALSLTVYLVTSRSSPNKVGATCNPIFSWNFSANAVAWV